eukprot:s4448_g2.t1
MFDVLAAIFVPEETQYHKHDLKTSDKSHRTHRSRRMSAESHRPVLSLVGTGLPLVTQRAENAFRNCNMGRPSPTIGWQVGRLDDTAWYECGPFFDTCATTLLFLVQIRASCRMRRRHDPRESFVGLCHLGFASQLISVGERFEDVDVLQRVPILVHMLLAGTSQRIGFTCLGLRGCNQNMAKAFTPIGPNLHSVFQPDMAAGVRQAHGCNH